MTSYANMRDASRHEQIANQVEEISAIQRLANITIKEVDEKIKEGVTVWTSAGRGPYVVLGPAEVPVGISYGSKTSLRARDGASTVKGWWLLTPTGKTLRYYHYDLTTKRPAWVFIKRLVSGFALGLLLTAAIVACYFNWGYLGTLVGGITVTRISQLLLAWSRISDPAEKMLKVLSKEDEEIESV